MVFISVPWIQSYLVFNYTWPASRNIVKNKALEKSNLGHPQWRLFPPSSSPPPCYFSAHWWIFLFHFLFVRQRKRPRSEWHLLPCSFSSHCIQIAAFDAFTQQHLMHSPRNLWPIETIRRNSACPLCGVSLLSWLGVPFSTMVIQKKKMPVVTLEKQLS